MGYCYNFMRPPAKIKPWLSNRRMFNWMQNAPDENSRKRRRAIWLTHTEKLSARKVAQILGVSTQAVWLWIAQYNKLGPKGLERAGRGGRRRAFFSPAEEADILKPFIRRARSGRSPKTAEIKQLIEKKLSRQVSKSYIYRLLHRYRFSAIIAQSRSARAASADTDSFKKLSQPWLKYEQ